MIVDAHLHVWDQRVLRYPWLESQPGLGVPYGPSDTASDGVSRAIVVQADAEDGAAEARWIQGLAEDWPALAGIVAFAPVEDPDALADVLDGLSALPLLRGVRRLLQGEPAAFLRSPALVDGLAELGRRGLPFDACVRHPQLRELVDLGTRVPETTMVLDHLGKPPVAAGLASPEGRAWADGVRALAERPGTAVKLSGLAPEADPGRGLGEQIAPFVAHALDAFGAGRVMVGSDFPVSGRTANALSRSGWFELVDRLTGLEGAERDALFSGTAERVYRL